MRALSIKQALELSTCWDFLSKPIYIVTNGREFLVEPPEERQDRDGEEWEVVESADSALVLLPVDEEAVLRIWFDHEDAWLYCEQQQENYDVDNTTMRVLTVSMERLFELKKAIINNSLHDFDVPVRADVCTIRDGEPRVIDTLWSSTINAN